MKKEEFMSNEDSQNELPDTNLNMSHPEELPQINATSTEIDHHCPSDIIQNNMNDHSTKNFPTESKSSNVGTKIPQANLQSPGSETHLDSEINQENDAQLSPGQHTSPRDTNVIKGDLYQDTTETMIFKQTLKSGEEGRQISSPFKTTSNFCPSPNMKFVPSKFLFFKMLKIILVTQCMFCMYFCSIYAYCH